MSFRQHFKGFQVASSHLSFLWFLIFNISFLGKGFKLKTWKSWKIFFLCVYKAQMNMDLLFISILTTFQLHNTALLDLISISMFSKYNIWCFCRIFVISGVQNKKPEIMENFCFFFSFFLLKLYEIDFCVYIFLFSGR